MRRAIWAALLLVFATRAEAQWSGGRPEWESSPPVLFIGATLGSAAGLLAGGLAGAVITVGLGGADGASEATRRGIYAASMAAGSVTGVTFFLEQAPTVSRRDAIIGGVLGIPAGLLLGGVVSVLTDSGPAIAVAYNIGQGAAATGWIVSQQRNRNMVARVQSRQIKGAAVEPASFYSVPATIKD